MFGSGPSAGGASSGSGVKRTATAAGGGLRIGGLTPAPAAGSGGGAAASGHTSARSAASGAGAPTASSAARMALAGAGAAMSGAHGSSASGGMSARGAAPAPVRAGPPSGPPPASAVAAAVRTGVLQAAHGGAAGAGAGSGLPRAPSAAAMSAGAPVASAAPRSGAAAAAGGGGSLSLGSGVVRTGGSGLPSPGRGAPSVGVGNGAATAGGGGEKPPSRGSTGSGVHGGSAAHGGAAAAAGAAGAAGGLAGLGGRPPGGASLVKREKLTFALKDLSMYATVGTGTFGRVRVVQHKPTRGFFALKILKKSEIIRLKQVDHIKSEVKILSTVHHPFIVNLFGFLQDDRRMYMLFEYVPGGELFSHLRREGKFGNDQARLYAAQITLAFEYLHSFKIVYRDLKPENLLLSAKGNMKITDFGFAKVVDDRTWTLCGTPEYLAPEIIQSKGHDRGVDWWAIGILIYEMLAGYPPFYDETPYGIYQKILAGRIDFPRHFSDAARDLVKRLLTADKTKRLGCLRGGAVDIKEHPWYAKLSWDDVFACRIETPFKPRVRDEKDTSNFDDYPESDEDTAGRLAPRDADLFVEFDTF